MKFRFVLPWFFLLCVSISSSAKVWRVNNNNGVQADFTTVALAIANAAVVQGDTIYVEPSATAYAGGTLNKQLVLIGAGYYLSENLGLQFGTNDSHLSGITLDSLGSGSKLMGLRITSVSIDSDTDDIDISRCNVGFTTSSSSVNSRLTNWVVHKNVISSMLFNGANYVWENLHLRNNIILGAVSLPNAINSLVRNNVSTNGWTLSNAYVSNNFFTGSQSLTFTNCTVRYNMAQNISQLPAGNNNQGGVLPSSVILVAGTPDGRYQLRPGSLALNAGEPVNGVTPHIGPFGTDDPYRLSGIPPIPTIYALTAPASVPSSATTMNITISTRSNN